jgi:DNA-binding CsgD family transcriptional regulator
MDNGATITTTIDRLLPERLQHVRRSTGLPVAFGGVTRSSAAGQELLLTRLVGTAGSALRGLAVQRGRGLGGSVLVLGTPRRVADYATTTTITHDYDRVVVDEERLTSIAAVPVVVLGTVRAVLYAALRNEQPMGDRAVRLMSAVATHLANDVHQLHHMPEIDPAEAVSTALRDLAQVIAESTDPAVRARLRGIHQVLTAGPAGSSAQVKNALSLSPRELDVLRLAATGATNAAIAANLGLREGTVKAYLKTAMRKLGAPNRAAAVHAASIGGAF